MCSVCVCVWAGPPCWEVCHTDWPDPQHLGDTPSSPDVISSQSRPTSAAKTAAAVAPHSRHAPALHSPSSWRAPQPECPRKRRSCGPCGSASAQRTKAVELMKWTPGSTTGNLGQYRAISGDLEQSRAISGNLGQAQTISGKDTWQHLGACHWFPLLAAVIAGLQYERGAKCERGRKRAVELAGRGTGGTPRASPPRAYRCASRARRLLTSRAVKRRRLTDGPCRERALPVATGPPPRRCLLTGGPLSNILALSSHRVSHSRLREP